MNGLTLDKPIEVSGSTLPPTLAAALRYAVSLIGTYLVAKGYVDSDNIEGIATMLTVAAAVVYGLITTRQNRAKLIVAAEAAPNSIAFVK